MEINSTYFNHAYTQLLRGLSMNGDRVSPRGQPTKEILGVTIRVDNPLHNILWHPERDLNYKFMVAEFLWIMYGYDDVKTISQYNSKLVEYSDDGEVFWGAYGPAVQLNLPYVLKALEDDRESRQAVMEIWRTPWTPTKDVPCTLTAQYLLRNDRLYSIVSMRSSDAYLGLPYDFFVFSQIQNTLCGLLQVNPGFLQFNLGSAHMYLRNEFFIDKMLDGMARVYGSDRIYQSPPPDLATILNDPTLYPSDQEGFEFDTPWSTYHKVLTHPRHEALLFLQEAEEDGN